MKKFFLSAAVAVISGSASAQFNVGSSTSAHIDIFGNTVTTHRDSYGRTTGTSTTGRTDIFGNTTTTHCDPYGRTIGISTTGRTDIFGNTTTTHTDPYGRTMGTSVTGSTDIFGNTTTQHTDISLAIQQPPIIILMVKSSVLPLRAVRISLAILLPSKTAWTATVPSGRGNYS